MYLRSVLECNHFQDFWCIHPNSRNQFETGHTKHLTPTRRMRPITQKGKWNDDLDITMGPKKMFYGWTSFLESSLFEYEQFCTCCTSSGKENVNIRTLPRLSKLMKIYFGKTCERREEVQKIIFKSWHLCKACLMSFDPLWSICGRSIANTDNWPFSFLIQKTPKMHNCIKHRYDVPK